MAGNLINSNNLSNQNQNLLAMITLLGASFLILAIIGLITVLYLVYKATARMMGRKPSLPPEKVTEPQQSAPDEPPPGARVWNCCQSCLHYASNLFNWVGSSFPECILFDITTERLLELAEMLHTRDYEKIITDFGHRLYLAIMEHEAETQNFELCEEMNNVLVAYNKRTGENLPTSLKAALDNSKNQN